MSYRLLENVRQRLVDDTGVDALIGDRIFPEDENLRERLVTAVLPLVTFSLVNESPDSCGRIDALVQLDVIHKGLEKKTLWDIQGVLKTALVPRLLYASAKAATPVLDIRVDFFRQESADDTFEDERTNTKRLRSRWKVKFIEAPFTGT